MYLAINNEQILIMVMFGFQGTPSKQSHLLGELVPGPRYRAKCFDEFGLRSVVVAGLVFYTASGALSLEQCNGKMIGFSIVLRFWDFGTKRSVFS
jgi:hypothetical protein